MSRFYNQIRTLNPVYFAVVMATGPLDRGAAFTGLAPPPWWSRPRGLQAEGAPGVAI